jgi:ABC-type Co2+ transport system permease subunit
MLGELGNLFDLGELIRRVVKYLVEGIMVAIAAYAIPKRSLNLDEVMLIALTAAATFSILDTYVPSMAVSARSGAGFGMGANLVGFPRNKNILYFKFLLFFLFAFTIKEGVFSI